MYIDNPKKLFDDLHKLLFVEGDIEAAYDDNQHLDIHNLISIMKRWINSSKWDMNSEEFYLDFGDIETDEDVFMNFYDINTIQELKTRLKNDYNKLKRIYKIVQTELNLNKN